MQDLIEQDIKETIVFTTYSNTGRKLMDFTGKHRYKIQQESYSDLTLNPFLYYSISLMGTLQQFTYN
jgi:hypothetical protein